MIKSGIMLREGERAGEKVNFVPSPFPRMRRTTRRRSRRKSEGLVDNHTHLPPSLSEWVEVRAGSMKMSVSTLIRRVLEFYQHACTQREAELAIELRNIFPPGTPGIDKPFAMRSDAFRENIG